ncbi:MAG: F0F1 ATP synthase subunit A [Acidobacteria bacterium]|nr:F0F1 ATP synthase subunit A [Acidobacteriota bacterium]
MFLLNIFQEHGEKAAEGAAAAQPGVEAAGHAAGHGGGHHVPWLVEQVNHLLGPTVFEIQKTIMPPIYSTLKIFGPHWPGEGKTYEQYIASGELPIPTQIVMFAIVVFVAVVVLWILRGKLSTEAPTSRQQTFEVAVEAVRGFLADLVGPGAMKHFPVVMTFAILILLSNLLGMIPDMISPTANFNVTLALAITSFLYYNYIGIRNNGVLGHLKHFLGPVPWLAFLMFPIEIVSNLARILSLSIRLFGNIYGEEQVSGAISGMVQWGLPILLMPLGLLTFILQTFIFILLSMVYLGEVSHHDGHEHSAEVLGAVQSHGHAAH